MASLCLLAAANQSPASTTSRIFRTGALVVFTVRTETGLSTIRQKSRGGRLGRCRTGATHGMGGTNPVPPTPGRSETSVDPAGLVSDINAQITIPDAPFKPRMPDLIHMPRFLGPPRPAPPEIFLTPAPDHQIDPNLSSPQSKTPGG